MSSRFDLESPESEKLTDSVSEKEEKEVDETEQVHRLTITLVLLHAVTDKKKLILI